MLAHLLGLGVRDLRLVNPVIGLLVLRVINFGRRVEGRGEVFKKAASLLGLTVDQDVVGVVGANVDERGIKLKSEGTYWRMRV